MEPNVDTAGSTINTADINVWHKCFHVLPKKVNALYNLEAVEGLSIKNLPADGTPKYKCEAYIIARASRSRVPKVRDYQPLADKPFYTVSKYIEMINCFNFPQWIQLFYTICRPV